MLGRVLMLAAALSGPAAGAAASALLSLPLDCAPGVDCFIQNHFDQNPAEGEFRDYGCGRLGYDGHRGVDFRVYGLARLEGEGVPVLAMADGTVTLAEEPVTDPARKGWIQGLLGLDAPQGCGNTVRIEHQMGWSTQYCHLASSLPVVVGQKLRRGQPIGRMGMSGGTIFPHVHVELRHYDLPVDPFVGYRTGFDCENPKAAPRWLPEVAALLAYSPTGVMASGFSDGRPDIAAIRHSGTSRMTGRAPGLGIWADVYGLLEGDRSELTLYADGRPIAQESRLWDKDAGMHMFLLEATRPTGATAEYRAELRITRNGAEVLRYRWRPQDSGQ